MERGDIVFTRGGGWIDRVDLGGVLICDDFFGVPTSMRTSEVWGERCFGLDGVVAGAAAGCENSNRQQQTPCIG